MGPFEMVLGIVFFVTVGSIVKTAIEAYGRRRAAADDPEAGRLREEISMLKERLATLERITIEKENSLARQIEELRDS